MDLFSGDWSNLPEDLLISIAKRAVSMVDVFSFAAACRSWRSVAVATKEDFTSLVKQQVPLLLALSDDESTNELHNLTKDKPSEVHIPEATGKRYYSSNLGWIMTVSAEDMKVSLFNPFKINSQIELPDINGWPWHFLKKFALSSSPSWTSDYIVMVLGQCSTLEFCRPGDKQWTSIAIDKIGGLYDNSTKLDDIIYYKGQFFAVGRYGTIFVCDIEDSQQARLRVVVPQMMERIHSSGSIFEQIYLVESAGDLLVVSRFFDNIFGDEHRLTAFKVPLSYCKWSLTLDLEVCDLGERTLFIGSSSTSISVHTRSNSECRANCMYFTHPSVYDMEHREFEPLRKIHKSLNQRLWIQPSL